MGRMVTFAIALILFSASGYAAETVGVVRYKSGTAVVVRNGSEMAAAPGFKIEQGDVLKTGADGSLGVFFRDDASMSLGPSSVADISKFAFEPAKEEYSFIVKVLRGTLCYVSGLIGKLSPDSAKFETPVASLSIRGTKFAVKVDG